MQLWPTFGKYFRNNLQHPLFTEKLVGSEYSQMLSRLDIDENCFGLKGQTCYSAQVSVCRIVCRLGYTDLYMPRQSEAPGKKKKAQSPRQQKGLAMVQVVGLGADLQYAFDHCAFRHHTHP